MVRTEKAIDQTKGCPCFKTGLNKSDIRRHCLCVDCQANERLRAPLPLLHPTVLGPLGDVVRQATKFTAEHHGLLA